MGAKVLASSGRVKVRRFKRGDQKERLGWAKYTNPLHAHLNYSLSGFVERERWFLTRMTNVGRMYFAIEDEDGRLIGETSLREIDAKAKGSRLGIHLAPDRIGRGYGCEALTALLAYYFGKMDYRVMFLDVAAHNTRAIRLYEHLCFQHLAPFWRTDRSNLPIFTDERYAGIRRFFRRKGPNTECLFYDMVLTKEHYIESFPGETVEGDGAAEPTGPTGNDDAETILFQEQG